MSGEERKPIHGLLAAFDTPGALLEAARRTRDAGYERFEAMSPFPVDGLAEATGAGRAARTVARLALAGGIGGALAGFGLPVLLNLDYPLNVGGRGLIAEPAFLVVSFELMILFAVLAAIVGMIALNGLPRLHHPVFDARGYSLGSLDRFFLVIEAADPRFDREETGRFLEALSPLSVEAVSEESEDEGDAGPEEVRR